MRNNLTVTLVEQQIVNRGDIMFYEGLGDFET